MSSGQSGAAAHAFRKGRSWLYGQVAPGHPAWGAGPGLPGDPWTTGQVLSLGTARNGPEEAAVVAAVDWLTDAQREDGSWGSTAYGGMGDTPATAWGTAALLDHIGFSSLAAQRGCERLSRAFRGGWTTLLAEDQPFLPFHRYSTSVALRALVRGPRRPLHVMCVREGYHALSCARTKGAGWSYQDPLTPEPTFTAHTLLAVHDMREFWGLPIDELAVSEACEWLANEQAPDGFWRDWHGILQSPETTAASAAALLAHGALRDERLDLAIDALVSAQSGDGGWPMRATSAHDNSNWVTAEVLGLLDRYLDRFPPAIRYEGAKTAQVLPPRARSLMPLYEARVDMSLDAVPRMRPVDHTMFAALDGYVVAKVPAKALTSSVAEGIDVEVHGIHPDHARTVFSAIGYRDIRRLHRSRPRSRRWNRVRPSYFSALAPNGRPRILVAVTPGHDYVTHYASLVRHFLLTQSTQADLHLTVHRYPTAENQIAEWTALDERVVQPGDTVVLGYVDEVLEQLSTSQTESLAGDHYGIRRLQSTDGRVTSFVGVDYSFWGSISYHVVHQLCALGAHEVLYIAKLGALTGDEDLYSRVFSPSRFHLLNGPRLKVTVAPPPNRFLELRPDLDSGAHVSVPTVLEEGYGQRQLAIELGAASIDNEIAQMAAAVSTFNRSVDANPVHFSAVHFATDYVRGPDEKLISTSHDLARGRHSIARQSKRDVLHLIARDIVGPYLGLVDS